MEGRLKRFYVQPELIIAICRDGVHKANASALES